MWIQAEHTIDERGITISFSSPFTTSIMMNWSYELTIISTPPRLRHGINVVEADNGVFAHHTLVELVLLRKWFAVLRIPLRLRLPAHHTPRNCACASCYSYSYLFWSNTLVPYTFTPTVIYSTQRSTCAILFCRYQCTEKNYPYHNKWKSTAFVSFTYIYTQRHM